MVRRHLPPSTSPSAPWRDASAWRNPPQERLRRQRCPATVREQPGLDPANSTAPREGLPLSVFDKLSWTLSMAWCQFVKYPK
ncbi:hypothetical protein GN956_G16406 [Arapaima gigas]